MGKRYQKSQIEAIAKRVEEIARQQNEEYVDVIAVAKIFDLKINEVEFEDKNISGMIEYKEKTISIAARDSYARKRFSIAHEIGHYVLHHMLNEDENNQEVSYRANTPFQDYDPKETEANHFAATLLMPEMRVRELWERIQDVDDVAKKLQVSVSALCFRLEYLGLV